MQRSALYGIIAAVVVATGVGIAFAAMSGSTANTNSQLTSEQTSDNNQVRVIQHDMGETSITGTPERIVVLDTISFSILLDLGIQPVGVHRWEPYSVQTVNAWEEYFPGIAQRWSDAVNVGVIEEVNLEVVSQLKPDLIIAHQASMGNYEELSKIAPTILFDLAPPEGSGLDNLENVERATMRIADALNRHDDGVAIMERFHAKVDEAETKLEAAGLKGKKFVFVQAYGDFPMEIRLWTSISKPSLILQEMGMVDVTSGSSDLQASGRGAVDTGLEALASLDGPDVHFIYFPTRGDPVTTVWQDNPVWNSLSFVQDGRVYALPSNMYLTSGPPKDAEFVDAVVEVLTGDSSSQDSEIRTIRHAMGETEITGIPQRAITLDNVAIETLLALGIEPVGTYDLEGQKASNPQIAAEWTSAVDVGNIHEPNLEVIAQLEPDVIFASEAELSNLYGDLSEIAPTIMFNSWPYEEDGISMIDAVRKSTTTIAEIMGHKEEGAVFLERLEAKIADNAAKIEAAGLKGDKFIMASIWVNDETTTWTVLYIPNSQNSAILEEMGLVNAVPMPKEFDRYGELTSSLEGLTTLDGPDVHFLYVTLPGLADPVSEPGHWKDNPVWKNLSFVQEERVHHLGSISMYGGPLELEKLADAAASALTSGSGTRTISHVMGEITITETPQRVVTLYSVFAGDVRALGVQPAATVDRDWINGWLTPLGLSFSEDVVDVGIPDEPNLEVIARLEPDLIIGHGGVWGIHDDIYDDLNDIAPTMILDDSFSEEGLDELELGKSNLMKIADALNRHDEGVAFLENIESRYDGAAAKIEQAGFAGTKFVFVQAYLSGDAPGAYVFTQNSFSTKVMNNIGLVNDLPDPADTTDKWFETGMEGITTLDKPDTHLIVTYNAGQYEGNPLATSPLWDDLGFVKEGRVHDIGNTRVFGQVIFIEEIVNRVVDSFTSDS